MQFKLNFYAFFAGIGLVFLFMLMINESRNVLANYIFIFYYQLVENINLNFHQSFYNYFVAMFVVFDKVVFNTRIIDLKILLSCCLAHVCIMIAGTFINNKLLNEPVMLILTIIIYY